ARFMDRKARVLGFTDALGNPVQIYYDTATELPLGLELVEPGSDPPEPIIVEVSDWRPRGTVHAFHHAVFRHRGNAFVYTYEQLRFNAADPSLLRKPVHAADPQATTGG
ncbi:MAG: hypothetical protein ACPG77_17320, partial [Nannocystaceae bacterium]